jgi:hypothetical protein
MRCCVLNEAINLLCKWVCSNKYRSCFFVIVSATRKGLRFLVQMCPGKRTIVEKVEMLDQELALQQQDRERSLCNQCAQDLPEPTNRAGQTKPITRYHKPFLTTTPDIRSLSNQQPEYNTVIAVQPGKSGASRPLVQNSWTSKTKPRKATQAATNSIFQTRPLNQSIQLDEESEYHIQAQIAIHQNYTGHK